MHLPTPRRGARARPVHARELNMHVRREAGFRTIEASNGCIALRLFPELGAKLASLQDLRTGREWLWRSQRVPLGRHRYGESYIEKADSGGWDECFPTVAACEYPLWPARRTHLPDHGDLWSQEWTTHAHRYRDCLAIRNSCQAVALPCEFVRTLILPARGATLHMHYEVRNLGPADVAFIWSAHPLLRLQPGMRLRFPESARFNVYSAAPGTRLSPDTGLIWPLTVEHGERSVKLERMPAPDARVAFKIWSDPLEEGWAAVSAEDGTLRMQFDVREIPQVALWLNAGGWSGAGGEPEYNFALEPCIGAQDSLQDAVVKHGRYGLLRGGATQRWALQIALTPEGADQISTLPQ